MKAKNSFFHVCSLRFWLFLIREIRWWCSLELNKKGTEKLVPFGGRILQAQASLEILYPFSSKQPSTIIMLRENHVL